MKHQQRLAPRTPLGQPRLDVQAALGDDTLVLADRLARRALVEADHPRIADSVARIAAHSASTLNTRPVAAFGSKYVDFWGMTSPSAATSSTAAMGVDGSRKAASALPAATSAAAE